jgi:hypothetical protein
MSTAWWCRPDCWWRARFGASIRSRGTKVLHRAPPKNHQLDVFDPNDGHYENAADTSNLSLTVGNLWYFTLGGDTTRRRIA